MRGLLDKLYADVQKLKVKINIKNKKYEHLLNLDKV